MSFIPEDGSIVAGANSFISLADANTYHADRRSAATWTALTDAQKQAALIEATSYINTFRWASGSIINDDQALSWPRAGAVDREGRMFDSDVIPEQVKQATAELAYRIRSAEVMGDQERQENAVKVGSMAVEYDAYARRDTLYAFVERLLLGLIEPAGCGRIERG